MGMRKCSAMNIKFNCTCLSWYYFICSRSRLCCFAILFQPYHISILRIPLELSLIASRGYHNDVTVITGRQGEQSTVGVIHTSRTNRGQCFISATESTHEPIQRPNMLLEKNRLCAFWQSHACHVIKPKRHRNSIICFVKGRIT